MTSAAASILEPLDADPARQSEPALPHLYFALTECGDRGEGRPIRGTSAAIWQMIDRLRAEGDRAPEIRILEQISIEVHRLAFILQRPERGSALAARRRISDLTEEWLGVARLFA